jgi:uncharacterized membrane protein (DUF4010 family)
MVDLEAKTLLYRFAVALAIGMLIGIQREYSAFSEHKHSALFAGVRTFPLFSLAGCTAAWIADLAGSAGVLIVTCALLGLLIVAAYVSRALRGDVGMTTEAAALLAVLIGALCFYGELLIAAALGIACAVLLTAKLELRRFVSHITREDEFATLKFAVITAIVLPVLPNEPLGPPPFDVLRPYQVWLMVVLISGIGFLGYVLVKLAGPRRGLGLTGVMGGLVSSTAVTLSLAQRSRARAELAPAIGLALFIAWSIMFLRVLLEVAIVNRSLLGNLWPPLVAATGAGIGVCVWLYRRAGRGNSDATVIPNPFELGPALRFGLLFAVILVVSRAAQLWLGETGIYMSALLGGTTDVDAVTLSMAQMSRSGGELSNVAASRAIVLATIANTFFKGGIVLVSGSPALRRILLPALLVPVLAAGVVLWFG